MSEENVGLVRQGFEAWNRGDLEWLLDHTTPDGEFRTAQVFPDTEAVYRGHEAFSEFWITIQEPWTSFLVEVERIEAIGADQVLALLWFHGSGREGVEVTVKWASLITVEDGLMSQVINFADWQEALEAAGLLQ
jgi:ketosteroid isomerase-like protein